MKAARYYGPGEVRVEDVEEPITGHGQVKIKVAWNALSATDAHMFSAHLRPLAPTASKPNRLTGEKLPITMGHQFSGAIVEIGPGVDSSKWKRGQRVAVAPLLSCNQGGCMPCATGRQNVCPKATLIGVGGRGGGLAEHVSVDVRNVHHLPASVSLEAGAMLEPLAVAYHAVRRSGYKQGQTVLVSGAGPVGLLVIQVLRQVPIIVSLQLANNIGLTRSIDPSAIIIVTEISAVRRGLASQYGATEVVDPLTSQGIVLAKVYGETMGAGVDVAFETAGEQSSLDTALVSVKPHGSLVNLAIWEQSPNINMNLLNAREVRLTGIMGYGGEYPAALEGLATGRVAGIEDLATKKIRLQDVVQEGFLPLVAKKETRVKILVQPS